MKTKKLTETLKFKKFEKSERSSFSYWFNHWKAFNAVAKDLGVWKIKYLFHDIEKPWLKLFLRDYAKVQEWHREHNAHHLEYKYAKTKGYDYEAMVIDWECSRYTKIASPRTALEEMNHLFATTPMSGRVYFNLLTTAKKLGLSK